MKSKIKMKRENKIKSTINDLDITDISELRNAFIIQDRDANITLSKKEELERANAI